MSNPNKPNADPSCAGEDRIHSESFLHLLMRRQLRLSIACAATFLIALLGLPLLNYFAPDLMARRLFGFTLTWFILGVLFFPFVWIISWIFIRRSIALEQAEVNEIKTQPPPPNPQPPTSRVAAIFVLIGIWKFFGVWCLGFGGY